MSDRFYFDGPLHLGECKLLGPEAHHLANVRRLAAGDAVALFNGDGREYLGSVAIVTKKQVTVEITQIASPDRELGFRLHIASALPKGDRGDFLIEKLTELGVTDFTPLCTERGVVKATDHKTEKLKRAVIEASKQCGRIVLMEVHPPANWLAWCAQQVGHRLMAHPLQTAARLPIANGNVIAAFGPEGGFTEAEVLAGVANGWKLMSLGPRTLRIETAAIAATAFLSLVDASGQ